MRRRDARGVLGLVVLTTGALLLAGCQSAADPLEESGPTPSPSSSGSAAPEQTSAEGGPITLAFGGDVHFEAGLLDVPDRAGSTLGPMSRTLRQADLAMVNLEAALTRPANPAGRAGKLLEDPGNRYWFRSPPSALRVLDRSGVDVVTVANNHGADYGAAGLRDTLRAGRDGPVGVVGAGRNPTEAYTPYRTTVRGTDVAFFGADASPREDADPAWAVTEGEGPGLASARPSDDAALTSPLDPGRGGDLTERRTVENTRLVEAVRAAAAQDDLVVVYLHWGAELQACPTALQRDLAAALSEAGADIVVGAHAHVPLGAGTLGDTYVGYGLGNFFWYHGNQPETGVLRLEVSDGEVVADRWVPGVIRPDGGNPQPLSGRARAAAVADWEGLRSCTGLEPGPGEQAADATDDLPAFESSVRRIGAGLRDQMLGSSHRAACPVPLSDLRHLAVSYVGFDGAAHDGVLVVAADVVDDVQQVFAALYAARFPIERMRLVDAYGADDNASMAANNTSAYNCRTVAGSTSFSAHAYGRAVDINPVQNPYVVGGDVRPPAGRDFVSVDRSAGAETAPGVIRDGDVVRRTFARLGWEWGGDFSEPDFQHFSKP